MLTLLLVGQLFFTNPTLGPKPEQPARMFFASFSSQGYGILGTYFHFPQRISGLDLGMGLMNLRWKGRDFAFSTLSLSYSKDFHNASFHFRVLYTFPLRSLEGSWHPFLR